jgi:hypothetical protein
MPKLNYSQFYESLRARIKSRAPFSAIRIGDGEGIILGYPERTSRMKMDKRLDKWFGSGNMLDNEKIKFARDLRSACRNADMLGIPGMRHDKLNQDWRNVKRYITEFELSNETQEVFCMDCTIELQTNHKFNELLAGIDRLYCISCRALNDKISAAFDIKIVETFLIPPQNTPYRTAKGMQIADTKHYPDLYYLALKWIEQRALNNLFFIGAGGLGKIYCDYVKKMGGMVLDVGSLFDGWAGLKTRSYVNDAEIFSL